MSDTLDTCWREILSLVRQKLPQQTYETWFAPLKPAARVNGSFSVVCPNPFFRDWFSEHHLPLLQEAVGRCFGQPLECLLRVDPRRLVFKTLAANTPQDFLAAVEGLAGVLGNLKAA